MADAKEVEGIVNGLSKSQRRAIRIYVDGWSIDKLGIGEKTSCALHRKGLWRGFTYNPSWTELGLAVRERISPPE